MARIRSIHPGIWTDEDFASVSMGARVLYFGLLTEADDHGVFEWKPVGLKMRIFPADKVNVEALLTELASVNKIQMALDTDGKFGVIRNFCRYQRPKKPNYRFVLPKECRTYVGLSDDGSEPVPNWCGSGSEKSSQMEEGIGGGNRKKKEEDSPADAGSASKYAFESGVIRLTQKDFDKWKANFTHIDVGAELIAMTDWAGQQPRWFPAVSGLLGKRNREAKIAAEKQAQQPFKWNGIEGVV